MSKRGKWIVFMIVEESRCSLITQRSVVHTVHHIQGISGCRTVGRLSNDPSILFVLRVGHAGHKQAQRIHGQLGVLDGNAVVVFETSSAFGKGGGILLTKVLHDGSTHRGLGNVLLKDRIHDAQQLGTILAILVKDAHLNGQRTSQVVVARAAGNRRSDQRGDRVHGTADQARGSKEHASRAVLSVCKVLTLAGAQDARVHFLKRNVGHTGSGLHVAGASKERMGAHKLRSKVGGVDRLGHHQVLSEMLSATQRALGAVRGAARGQIVVHVSAGGGKLQADQFPGLNDSGSRVLARRLSRLDPRESRLGLVNASGLSGMQVLVLVASNVNERAFHRIHRRPASPFKSVERRKDRERGLSAIGMKVAHLSTSNQMLSGQGAQDVVVGAIGVRLTLAAVGGGGALAGTDFIVVKLSLSGGFGLNRMIRISSCAKRQLCARNKIENDLRTLKRGIAVSNKRHFST